jgi:pilus assembly protein TadC
MILVSSLFVGMSIFCLRLSQSFYKHNRHQQFGRLFSKVVLILIPEIYANDVQNKLNSISSRQAFGLKNAKTWLDVLNLQIELFIFAVVVSSLIVWNTNLNMSSIILPVLFVTMLPYFSLKRELKRQKIAIASELPGVLEVIAFLMDAGLSFDEAVKYMVRRKKGRVVEILKKTKSAISAGMLRDKAYLNIAGAIDNDLKTVTRSILQAEKQGKPIKKTLLDMAGFYRAKQRSMLEEAANKLPSTMLIPIFIFIIPPILLVYMMPIIATFTGANL